MPDVAASRPAAQKRKHCDVNHPRTRHGIDLGGLDESAFADDRRDWGGCPHPPHHLLPFRLIDRPVGFDPYSDRLVSVIGIYVTMGRGPKIRLASREKAFQGPWLKRISFGDVRFDFCPIRSTMSDSRVITVI